MVALDKKNVYFPDVGRSSIQFAVTNVSSGEEAGLGVAIPLHVRARFWSMPSVYKSIGHILSTYCSRASSTEIKSLDERLSRLQILNVQVPIKLL